MEPASRKKQLWIICAGVLALSACVSHLTAWWLGLVTRPPERLRVGADTPGAPVLVSGSSLIGFGIDWERMTQALQRPADLSAAPSASPCELEVLQERAPKASLEFIGVSAYELNENNLSDFRADIIPLGRSVRALRESRADWRFAKRVVSLYPLAMVRKLFPTAGRSSGVMVGLREQLRRALRAWRGRGAGASGAGPSVAGGSAHVDERISDWPAGRTLRNLSELRRLCLGRQAFNGPKKLALQLMLERATQQGQAVVVVLPVSPPYAREFLTPDAARAFEESIADVQRRVPAARWVRLDQVPALQSADVFWDLAHMNGAGREISTGILQSGLKEWGIMP